MDLQTLKNNYAQEHGYEDWADLYRESGWYDETIFFKHENAVIILAEKAALENAAENVDTEVYHGGEIIGIDRKSITDPENLIL